jgi:hypothetical protein
MHLPIRPAAGAVGRWLRSVRPERAHLRADVLAGLPGAIGSVPDGMAAGVLPPEAFLDFDRLTASIEPVETVVHGPIQDQAALNGLLARLEAFGMQVIEIRRLHEKDQTAGKGRP